MNIPPTNKPKLFTSVPEGADALVLAEISRKAKQPICHIASDDKRMVALSKHLHFFAPDIEIITLPAWDCLPYDRVSPAGHIISRRMKALCRLAEGQLDKAIIVTTVNASLQKVIPKELLRQHSLSINVGKDCPRERLTEYLVHNGYERSATANDPGEYALRGSIIDIFPPGYKEGFRLDFFGETVESIRAFDPLSQVTVAGKHKELQLHPASEIFLNSETIERFRITYRELFGAVTGSDPLYEAISEGRKYPGMEHWLPLFYSELDSIFNYMDNVIVSLDHLAAQAGAERHNDVLDHYAARKEAIESHLQEAEIYHPVMPEMLYEEPSIWQNTAGQRGFQEFSPYREERDDAEVLDCSYHAVPNFASEGKQEGKHPFELLKTYLSDKIKNKDYHIVIACISDGSRERMQKMLQEAEVVARSCDDWRHCLKGAKGAVSLVTLGLECGFQSDSIVLITEQDLLGERIIRSKRRKSAAENFITETSALSEGELVVHRDHGLGRFEALETIEAGGKKHDCLRILYDGGDKLYIPVENIDVLTHYGSEAVARLDKLGSASWQARTAKLKKRIRMIADGLLKIAAERLVKKAPVFQPMSGLYDEFCSRFPYPETDDQLRAIEEVMEDLSSGKSMDRLICGDVGFGKTEVALRAAFTVAASKEKSAQVALVAPTTLLARQHYATFKKRFADMPVEIRQLSRMVPAKEAKETKALLKEGKVDIVVGTHAVLAKSIEFKNLSLVIVDEEQLFGVTQKERLKELCRNIHVLTLSATPIPRTLQMSLSGIRDLTLIATPPVDRLAVRTYVMPYDGVVLRDAILREHYRGGRTFYVAPRISDLHNIHNKLKELVPEVKVVVAHGQMTPDQLDDIMNAFYDGRFDLLLATNIVGSGLDVPAANTMIIHRADMFGLAQLYQLRGRVGRGKIRAYAYLTLPAKHKPSKMALKKLEVMHSLDTLGAGFTVASHDMDIRGFGNLLGDEQSGHIKEVGIELYQDMLKEAIETAKAEADGEVKSGGDFSPQINLGISVLIPDSYIEDLSLRLAMYRRAAGLQTAEEVEGFAAELIDRFGPLPEEVENLLAITAIKRLCLQTGVERVDAGAKGVVVGFHNNEFKNPEALLSYISKNPLKTKVRADQRIVLLDEWKTASERIKGTKAALEKLLGLAA